MLQRLTWLCRGPAVIFATLFLLAGAYFGSSRDFGTFLSAIPVMAPLFLSALAATL
ncbi:hypothetical protein [Paludibacterium sp.]|uniref:hypothetical protein n=1 Tax=Paludibacterium sp. TaxID=1917523 RepID=UPI0025FBB06E|nr:hypothetical protein [Paludibacterium sp.]MBV8647378.1 hypothetical protein [Paludibacterium sp.]